MMASELFPKTDSALADALVAINAFISIVNVAAVICAPGLIVALYRWLFF